MSSKKNIAFLLTKISKRGGISRVVSILSDDLYFKNIYSNIHIISFQERDIEGYNWNENLKFHELMKGQPTMKKGILKAAIKIRKILDEQKIDILISCGHLVGPLGALSCIFKKTFFIYWSHSSFEGSGSNSFRIYNEQIASMFSNAVVSLTKADVKNYRKKTFARKVVQIYNPVDSKLLSVKTNYNPNSKSIISVGRLTYQKNFELLVDVAQKVLKKNPEFQWHVYGSGENKNSIQEKIIAYGLEKKLILKGQCNNLYEIYNNYCLMVMTSRYEGFPMTLLEGVAFKLPMVSFDIPTGPDEIIQNDINGFLIKPLDIDAMANKICLILQNEKMRMNFSERNSTLLTEFNLKSISEKWIKLFNSIATKK